MSISKDILNYYKDNYIEASIAKNGLWFSGKTVRVFLPKKCCGSEISTNGNDINGNSEFPFINGKFSICSKHMTTWKEMWENFGPGGLLEIKADQTMPASFYGHSCIGCGEYNEYAMANQNNGTHKCYSCRTQI